MEQHLLLLLLLTANTLGNPNKAPLGVESLQKIPPCDDACNITKLLLNGSQITLTEEDKLTLATYSNLEELDLSGSKVTQIPAKYFAVVCKLRVLSLSTNQISSLDVESFSGLDHLTQLDLSHNLLTSIDVRLFTRLNKTEVLNLQGNPWNCSCPLTNINEDHKASELTDVVEDFLIVVPECNQSATSEVTTCGPGTTATTTAAPQTLSSAHTIPETAVTSQRTTAKDRPPEGGNSWKFTVCVAALAAGTFMLILCAIKGPSWYKLYHNYRHRRLREQEEEGEGWEGQEQGPGGVSINFSDTSRQGDSQLFTFDFHRGQTEDWGEEEEEEEEEDAAAEEVEEGYFEDPYFKRED